MPFLEVAVSSIEINSVVLQEEPQTATKTEEVLRPNRRRGGGLKKIVPRS
jgi:hypothetical protein